MKRKILLGLACGLLASAAFADIDVGVTLSATGPAASLGIPEKNSFAFLPTTIAGHKVTYHILDDGSDTCEGRGPAECRGNDRPAPCDGNCNHHADR